MKKVNVLWVMALALIWTGLTTLTSCSSSDEDIHTGTDWTEEGLTLTRDSKSNDIKVIRRFERNGIKLQLLDITEWFSEATYWKQTVPVNHIQFENLPAAIQEIAERNGSSILTKVYRFTYKGEYIYDFTNLLSSSLWNLYTEQGERYESQDVTFDQMLSEATDICCILVLDIEIIKDAINVPNYLVGIWQNDWQHLVHDQGERDIVALYPALPFSITEVMNFREDGTGYLRTVKTFKDGRMDVAYDPFRYELTDYHGGNEYGYHGYYYKCYYEAGDIIEYLGRSDDNMQTLITMRCLVNYPWFKQPNDQYESLPVNVGLKYGTPAKDTNNPIVGRWSGENQSEKPMTAISSTWVFRPDNTGYRLLNGMHKESFAYTVEYKGTDAELTIYKYNTGFMVDEGFAKSIVDTAYDPDIAPTGQRIKAKMTGNTLEIEGWTTYQRED